MLARWIRRGFDKARLRDPSYRFLFEPSPPGEVVAVDCETTGLDLNKDDIIAISAIRIRGARILTSERFEAKLRSGAAMAPAAIKVHGLRHADVATGRPDNEAIPELLRFIGGRPLVGYFIEFDVGMLDKHVSRLLGFRLPNPRIEVSRLYYERKYADAPPLTQVDLSFAAILADLGLPMLDQHDATSDALMTAMIYLALRDLKARGVRIKRRRDAGAHGF
jgi:DNA polymerase-3 subunit epsilon